MHNSEIINADVCELRAARNFANRPNAGRGRLQAIVDLDVSAVGQLNAGQLQAESLCIRITACRHQYMTAVQYLLSSVLLDDDAHGVSRLSGYPLNPGIQKNVDALVLK
jgi:hypothetical protein